MADEKKNLWHGIPREEVPWRPTVDASTCVGCQLCYVTCGRGVYEMEDGLAVAVSPLQCMVGCTTCANICPVKAITFPPLDVVWKLERERHIFAAVKKEARAKHEREAALRAREKAQSVVPPSTRATVEVAGEFGDKQFLLRLEELIEGKPFDIVSLRLEVATLKGAKQKAPSFLRFDVTSEQQADVSSFLDEVKRAVHDAGLVWVSATPR